jgi:hypothetical protein
VVEMHRKLLDELRQKVDPVELLQLLRKSIEENLCFHSERSVDERWARLAAPARGVTFGGKFILKFDDLAQWCR